MHALRHFSIKNARDEGSNPGAVYYRWAEPEGVFVPVSSGFNPSMLLMVVGVVFVFGLFYYHQLLLSRFFVYFVYFVVKIVVLVAANGYAFSVFNPGKNSGKGKEKTMKKLLVHY